MSDETTTQASVTADTTAPGAAIPETTVAETVKSEVTEGQTPEAAGEQPKADAERPEGGDKPKRNSAQDRIRELSAQKRAAEERARQAEERLRALEAKPPPAPDSYNDQDAYHRDVVMHAARVARAEELRAEKSDAERLAGEARQSQWQAKVQAVGDSLPDFDRVFHGGLHITEQMADALVESDVGPQIAYYLGKNPQEAARIAAMPPHRQGLALGRIEAKVSVPPPKRVSSAPPPPPTVTGGASRVSQPDPEKMSFAEYERWRNAG